MSKIRILQLLLYGFGLFSCQQACTTKWTKSIQYGSIQNQPFNSTVNVELINGLIIIPVQLGGKDYKFLFDTGAPNSISQEIQNELNYKMVSKGHIVDSDQNRAKVKYIQIDSLMIGNLPFYDQTAFVGDFTQNPLIKCLNIDGIVGSNLMRHCNWTIDYRAKRISMTNDSMETNELSKISFQTDNQYNILVDLNVGKAKVKNITVDYGSNGSLSLPTKTYTSLQNLNEINKSYNEIGFSQAGMIGNVIKLNREMAYVDSLWLGDEYALNARLTSEKSGLLGSKVLSNWVISIDWSNQYLILQERQEVPIAGVHGFGIGFSQEKGVYIQSVIVDGPAHQKGLRPGMKVVKINDKVFDKKDGFCTIAKAFDKSQKSLEISVEDFNGKTFSISTEKTILN